MSSFNYHPDFFSQAIECANKASASMKAVGDALNNISSKIDLNKYGCSSSSVSKLKSIYADITNIDELLSTNGKNDVGSNPFDIMFLPYKLGKMKEEFDNLMLQESKTLRLNDKGMAELLKKYKENPSSGFELWISDNKYSMSDFSNSILAKKYGLTAEQAYNCVVAAAIEESDKTPDDVLAVMSVLLNRCESDHWSTYYENGTNPFDQLFVMSKDGGYQWQRYNWEEFNKYNPDYYGIEKIKQNVLDHRTGYSYDDLKQTIDDALFGGVRNNDYTAYWAYNYSGGKGLRITERGNEFYYGGYGDHDEQVAMQNKMLRQEQANNAVAATPTTLAAENMQPNYQKVFDDILTSPEEQSNSGEVSTTQDTSNDNSLNKNDNNPTQKTPSYYGGGGGGEGISSTFEKDYVLTIKYVYQYNINLLAYTETKIVKENTVYNYVPREVSYYSAIPSIITGIMPSSDMEVLVTYVPLVDTDGNGKADEEEQLYRI